MLNQDNDVGTTTPETTGTEAPVVVDTKISQKDAVYNFVREALVEGNAIAQAEGMKLKELVTKDIRKIVRTRLFQGMKGGDIKMKRPMDDSKLKKYSSGLINNWLKKDPRFN